MLFRITYQNGTTQVKRLIDHRYWTDLQRRLTLIRHSDISREGKVDLMDHLQKSFKEKHGDLFFTTESALGKALSSQQSILSTEYYYGVVQFTLL